MPKLKPIKFVFKSIGERWCFNIPNVHTVESVDTPSLLDDYSNLEVGDILESQVGHADYNTATFDVELTVRSKSVDDDGKAVTYLYTIELTKYPNP